MTTPASRVGDMSCGHGCYPPYPLAAGSPNVFVNGIAAGRNGDSYTVHCCNCCDPVICHSGSAIGSSVVRINGKVAHRKGNGVSCGDSLCGGSPNVRYG